jgi:phosphatidylglycerophosphate synthase
MRRAGPTARSQRQPPLRVLLRTRRISPGAVSACLVTAILPLSAGLGRRYGRAHAARFAAASTGALAGQQALVSLALRRQARSGGADRLGIVDLMTLSRGLAAAVLVGLVASGTRDRTGFAGWIGWLGLFWGSVVCDWLDGPIARRLGTSPAGAIFDLEADSWLTLSTAAAAAAWGGLPGYCLAAPGARYVLLGQALRDLPYRHVFDSEPGWARWSGIAQMLLFTAALAPFGGRFTRVAVRLAAPVVAPVQLGVMLALHLRLGLGRSPR